MAFAAPRRPFLTNMAGTATSWSVSLRTVREAACARHNYAQHVPLRRQMMQAWADYLDKLRSSKPEDARCARMRMPANDAASRFNSLEASNDVAVQLGEGLDRAY